LDYETFTLCTAEFKTPVGSSTFSLFAVSLAVLAEKKKKHFARWHFKVCGSVNKINALNTNKCITQKSYF
jgi:hypothetical protein